MVELIITEKPQAALKVAQALADGKAIKENIGGIPYYKVTHGKKDILVGCAVGHLFGLKQKEKNYNLPVFDIEWTPTYEVSKSSSFSKKYFDALKKLSKEADEFTIATDYDIEGEVIGLNIIRYIAKKKDANRMMFSTLTKPDLVKAYETKTPHLDWGQAKAGETRHMLDWFYGINSSRALSNTLRSVGIFKILSSGRVQGPALKLVVDKEKEIMAFIPTPYWQIELNGLVKTAEILAMHEEDKFLDKSKAEIIYNKIKNEKKATVKDMKTSRQNHQPPFPFDLTSLQVESHKCLNISPKDTLSIAQELYTNGFISYPRTSSQELSEKIGYVNIIKELAKQKEYSKESLFLQKKKNLKPNNGKKTDPAHPAIYPTGIIPKFKNEREEKLYDLITRRFLATFGDIAIRETMTVELDCKSEIFICKGTRTVENGWHDLYGRYVMLKEEELPSMSKKDIIEVKNITLYDKETQPPKRFTESSIIKELEKRNLGTKSTRATIVETLFSRGYVSGSPIKANELGIQTANTLEKYNPKIIDENLTRHFEEEMDDIRVNKLTSEQVLEEAKKAVTEIVEEFKKHQNEIGRELRDAEFKTMNDQSLIGKCPLCKVGELHLRNGKFGNFAACNKYPECKFTISLPGKDVKPTIKVCEKCTYPMVKFGKGKRTRELCINVNCESKKTETAPIDEGKVCPKCSKGKLVLRNSIYGKFIGCSAYPTCRYIEKLK